MMVVVGERKGEKIFSSLSQLLFFFFRNRTDINLVGVQLQIAMGIPLHRIPDIRRLYNQSPFGDNRFSFALENRRAPTCHVIAARITGENTDNGFKPTSGNIRELTFRSAPRVWGYFSVNTGGALHEYADSQFGHIFARGETREQARKELANCLKEMSIRGDISNTVPYLAFLLETPDFKNNTISTQWLDG
jgi:biotin carboxylase